MKTLAFDTSPIISLATNNLLWTLKDLKKQFNGRFLISESVHKELVDNPIKSKRFKLEALMIQDLISDGCLEVFKEPVSINDSQELFDIANRTFMAKNRHIKIIDIAEFESLVIAANLNSSAYVVDERTIRLLIENPMLIATILKERLHTKIEVNYENLETIKNKFGNVKIIRSVELMLIAYKLKLFDNLINQKTIKNSRVELLDGLLWALKLHGCSISDNEIQEILNSKISKG